MEKPRKIDFEPEPYRFWMLIVFILVLVAELAGAYFIVYQNGDVMADAVTRTANAFYVMFLEPSRLASIGFTWPPLPSLLQMPVLLFIPMWEPLSQSALAGSIVSAFFAAANAALIYSYLRQLACKMPMSMLLTLLYAANPFIFYYGCNGMAETLFFTTLIAGVACLSKWLAYRKTRDLAVLGVMLALSFLVRYESAPFAVAVFFGIMIATVWMDDPYSPFRYKPKKMRRDFCVATETVVLLPFLYTVLIILITNFVILGDPFYFITSSYSYVSQNTYMLDHSYTADLSAPMGAIGYGLIHVLPFIALYLVITVERICTKRFLKLDYLVFSILIVAFFGFHCAYLMTGHSYGFLRFFSYALPISMAWLPYELMQLKENEMPKAKGVTATFAVLALVASAALIPFYFSNPYLAQEEYAVFTQEEGPTLTSEKDMAERVNATYFNETILVDSYTAEVFILNLTHPENVITDVSENFSQAIEDPTSQNVEYFLVPTPDGAGVGDAINKRYPDLYYEGASWCELIEDNGTYRLYRVTG